MPQVGPDPPRRKVAAASTRQPYPVLTLRETLIFPLTTFPQAVGRESSRVTEKVLGAHRAGLRTVLVPRRNEADLEELPEQVRREMQFVALDSLDEALDIGLTKA